MLGLCTDQNRLYPVNPSLLLKRKQKAAGSGKAAYQYYYAPYVTLEIVELAISRCTSRQSNSLRQLEAIELNNQQSIRQGLKSQPDILLDKVDILSEVTLEKSSEALGTEESVQKQQTNKPAAYLTLEERVGQMLSLMAQKIKQQEQEINDLKKRLNELDKKLQSQTGIFDAVEKELKNLFAPPLEQKQNGKNGISQ